MMNFCEVIYGIVKLRIKKIIVVKIRFFIMVFFGRGGVEVLVVLLIF